jgi:hypothetical protein
VKESVEKGNVEKMNWKGCELSPPTSESGPGEIGFEIVSLRKDIAANLA